MRHDSNSPPPSELGTRGHGGDSASDQAIAWLARIRAADCTSEQFAQFALWLHARPEHKVAFDDATALWQLAGHADFTLADNAPNSDLGRIAEIAPINLTESSGNVASFGSAGKQVPPTQPLSLAGKWAQPSWSKAVAAAFLVFGIALLLTNASGGQHYRTNHGEFRVVVLQDDSVLHLNTDTDLTVHNTEQFREVALTSGEALFQVTPKQRPFRVKTANAEITVLGTAFSVRTDHSGTYVAVSEGKVRTQALTSPTTDKSGTMPPWTLTAGDALHLNQYGVPNASTVNPDEVAVWRMGRLIYYDVPLGDLLVDLNRYLPKKMIVHNPDLAQLTVSAVLVLDDQTAMLDALAKVLPLQWHEISENLVLVHPPKNT